jgi:hypothetical protein
MAPIDASSFDPPHPVLTKIGDTNTEPTFTSIPVAHVDLNANAASIYSSRGDRLHGHLALTIDANDYIKSIIGNKPFLPPAAPPAVPTHSTTASDAQITETNRQHKAQKEEFIIFHNADTALRNLLIAAVPPIFLADQRDPMTGFGNKTVLQLLTYLHTTFGSTSQKRNWNKTLLECSSNGTLQPPLKPCFSNLRVESLLLPPVKTPLPNQRSSAGHITSLKKRDALTLPVANGARWILTQKTGHSSSDISRLQTRISDASTRRALPGSIVQHTLSKRRAPC